MASLCETILTTPLPKFRSLPQRRLVQSGYGYVLPDQNGWSRLSALSICLGCGTDVMFGFITGHFRKNLLSNRAGSFVARTRPR